MGSDLLLACSARSGSCATGRRSTSAGRVSARCWPGWRSRGQPVSAEALLADVWGPVAGDSAAASLHVSVSKLRRAIDPDRAGAGVLSSGQHRRRLRPGASTPTRPRSRNERRRASGLLAAGDLEAAYGELAEARASWRGDPYEGVGEHSWLVLERRRCEELRLYVAELYAETCLRLGRDAAGVVVDLTGLAEQHPVARAARRAARRRALPTAAAGRRPRRAPVDPRSPARRVRTRPRTRPAAHRAADPGPAAGPVRRRRGTGNEPAATQPRRPAAGHAVPAGRTRPPSGSARRRRPGRRVRPTPPPPFSSARPASARPGSRARRPTTSSRAAGARCGPTAPRTKVPLRCGRGSRSSASSARRSRCRRSSRRWSTAAAPPRRAPSRPRTGGDRPERIGELLDDRGARGSAGRGLRRPALGGRRITVAARRADRPVAESRLLVLVDQPPAGRRDSRRPWPGWRGSAWSGSSSTD